ncbi:MAG: beta-galactosidase [Pseudomonadota bacterium]
MNRPARPTFPYGSVYYRRSNPPEKDWERDYAQAAKDGWTVFRHWTLWSAVNPAPGVWDWSKYDRQLDLAAEHGLLTIVQEKLTSAPIWAFEKYPEARLVHRNGQADEPQMSGSCASGGFPGLTLNHAGARELAGEFLTRLAERYKDHPGLGYYDIVNEAKFPQNQWGKQGDYDFSEPTQEAFRAWLKEKYGSLKMLAEAWCQFGYTDWAQVRAPMKLAFYTQSLDWLRFRVDNIIEQMAWRAETIRAVDPHTPVTSHGQAQALQTLSLAGSHDWRSAETVDSYGFTYVQSRHGVEPWMHMHAVDLTRLASRGKPFWHAEHQGGPVWMRDFQTGRPRNDGRLRDPEDIRLSNLMSMVGGARGVLYPRMRPLLSGPLFGTLGPYGNDGRPTERSAMTSQMAHWVREFEPIGLWDAMPICGDLAILVVEESQHQALAMHGSTDFYAKSARGAYRGFHEAGYQPDFITPDQLDERDIVYLPFPATLPVALRIKLTNWVLAGGRLISEGFPGYFTEEGWVTPDETADWLGTLFGVRQVHEEFFPDILDDVTFVWDGQVSRGGLYTQAFEVRGAELLAHYTADAGPYADGLAALANQTHGKGHTLLCGTHPGYGAYNDGSSPFFAQAAKWAGLSPRYDLPAPCFARLCEGNAKRFLWLINPSHEAIDVALPFDGAGETLRGTANVQDGTLTARLAGRDAVIVMSDQRQASIC